MKKFKKTDPRRGQGRGDRYGCFRYTLIPIAMIVILILLFTSGCCVAQIPTQYYFVNDSCEFYLPDYSQAVQVRDNCCVEGFMQEPSSGNMIASSEPIVVTLTGWDCTGNSTTMTFDVVTIDTIPPIFYYDSAQFIPTGMYQNDIRTYHFYTVIESTDSLGVSEMTHYYKY